MKNVLVRTLITRIPDERRGRAFAAYNGVRNGAELVALVGGGLLVSALGARWTLFLAGAAPIAAVAAMVGSTGRSTLRTPPARPALDEP